MREFVVSGLGQSEFCRGREIALNTLKRYLKRHGEAGNTGTGYGGLVAVELAAVNPAVKDCGTACAAFELHLIFSRTIRSPMNSST